MNTFEKKDGRDPANRDPLTGEPGSHPVGTGTGSAGGAVAGAAVGAVVGGPVGAVVGGAIGAVAGGAAGHAAGEKVNPTVEGAYWRENYSKRPYYKKGRTFGDYEPAYRHGWESAGDPSNKSRKFDEAEPDLQRRWKERSGSSGMDWSEARDASRDAWSRVRAE
jgi:hypothetical protein